MPDVAAIKADQTWRIPDPQLGDQEPIFGPAEFLVRNGTLVAVGPNLAAPAAEEIDGSNRIALPGFVDTHFISGVASPAASSPTATSITFRL